jgi:predicted MFS family arabinose efflux permease
MRAPVRQHATVHRGDPTTVVARGLPVQIAARFLSNLGFRLVFPFLPTIARGLDTSLGTVGVALSVREVMGLAGLPLGAMTDRGRHRRMMALAILAFAAGCLVAAVSPGVGVFALAMAACGIGKVTFDAAMGAWIGEHVPFAQRGRITGITELSWAGAFLVGVPIVAVLIEWGGWRTPFFVLAAANGLVAVALWRRLDPDVPVADHHGRLLSRPAPGVVALVVAVAGVVLGHQLVLVTFGAWFEDDFGLDVGGLGVLAIVLGVAELIGTVCTVAFTDRVGKARSIVLGALLMVPAVAAFGLADSRALAVLAVGVALLGFEYSFISALPYATEIDPEARGATLGLLLAVVTCIRAVGSVLGTSLYDGPGIGAVGIAAAVAIACGALTMVLLGSEPEEA